MNTGIFQAGVTQEACFLHAVPSGCSRLFCRGSEEQCLLGKGVEMGIQSGVGSCRMSGLGLDGGCFFSWSHLAQC